MQKFHIWKPNLHILLGPFAIPFVRCVLFVTNGSSAINYEYNNFQFSWMYQYSNLCRSRSHIVLHFDWENAGSYMIWIYSVVYANMGYTYSATNILVWVYWTLRYHWRMYAIEKALKARIQLVRVYFLFGFIGCRNSKRRINFSREINIFIKLPDPI